MCSTTGSLIYTGGNVICGSCSGSSTASVTGQVGYGNETTSWSGTGTVTDVNGVPTLTNATVTLGGRFSGTVLTGSSALTAISNSSYFIPFADMQLLVHNFNRSTLSDNIVLAISWEESRFDADRSNGAAYGLMGIRPVAVNEVNRLYGSDISHKDMFVPLMNVVVGTIYLKIMVVRWGDVTTALNHYGTGTGYGKLILRGAAALDTEPSIRSLQKSIGR
jgi:hypothetical protein